MPKLDIKGTKRGYQWTVRAEMNCRWLRLSQEQDQPNGLQVILLEPQQARELVDAYLARYG